MRWLFVARTLFFILVMGVFYIIVIVPSPHSTEVAGQPSRRAAVTEQASEAEGDAYRNVETETETDRDVFGPFFILDPTEAQSAAGRLELKYRKWLSKSERLHAYTPPYVGSCFAYVPECAALARHPKLWELARAHMKDPLLNSVEQQIRGPGARHRWHGDIEALWCPEALVVWLGLNNTREASPYVVPGSSQDPLVQFEPGMNVEPHELMLDKTDTERLQRQIAPILRSGRKVQRFSLEPGQVVAWRPGVWHATLNSQRKAVRSSVILRFMPAHCAARFTDNFQTIPVQLKSLLIPVAIDMNTNAPVTRARSLLQGPLVDLEQSFTQSSAESVVLLDVGREENHSASRFLSAARQGPLLAYPLVTRYRPCESPMQSDFNYKKLCVRQVVSTTATADSLAAISAHRSTQWKGDTPHTPHSHADSEIIIVLRGSIVVTRHPLSPALTPNAIAQRHLVHAPAVIVVPATPAPNNSTPYHTNTAVSDSAEYLCVHFQGRPAASTSHPTAPSYCHPSIYNTILPRDWNKTRTMSHRFFHRKCRTRDLFTLEGHSTVLAPGTGYAPHQDTYAVLIVILEGTPELTHSGPGKPEIRTTLAKGDSILVPEGSRFGMWNRAELHSAHIALEFHAN